MLLPPDGEDDLIQVPFVATARTAAAQFVGIHLPKLEAPLPDRFIADDNPALCEKLLDIAVTERKAEIQPDSVTDNFGWETECLCSQEEWCLFSCLYSVT